MKERIRKYIKKATFWDWLTNGAFVIIILILLVPSWRLAFQKTILGWTLGSPDIKKEMTQPEIPVNWNFYTSDGSTIAFQNFYDQKVFINFWASWCAPCLAEMPSLVQQSNELKGKVTFIFLTKDKKEKVKSVMQEYNQSNALFYFYSEIPETLSHNSIPYSIWINKGKLTAYYAGAAEWENEDILNGFE